MEAEELACRDPRSAFMHCNHDSPLLNPSTRAPGNIPSKKRLVARSVPSGSSIPTTTFAEPSPTNSLTRAPTGTETILPPLTSNPRSGSDRLDSHVSSPSSVIRDDALDAQLAVDDSDDDSSNGNSEPEKVSGAGDARTPRTEKPRGRGTGRLDRGAICGGAMGTGVAGRRWRRGRRARGLVGMADGSGAVSWSSRCWRGAGAVAGAVERIGAVAMALTPPGRRGRRRGASPWAAPSLADGSIAADLFLISLSYFPSVLLVVAWCGGVARFLRF